MVDHVGTVECFLYRDGVEDVGFGLGDFGMSFLVYYVVDGCDLMFLLAE